MSICILAGGTTTLLAGAAFTLSWTHSVEKTRWEEDWKATPSGLEVVAARVMGSGAGMEPPEGAILKDGWWSYVPQVKPQRQLVLAASGATGGGWTLCASGKCAAIGSKPGEPAVVTVCAP
ncbi:DUF1850 domain-containing protein [Taklimakanibacter lacteus]|uniref:DUF1850 domain-containing protein n=1 Tax=Taklimakanibacter lacteus TaxID=2268456 RepID=UPI000E66774E